MIRCKAVILSILFVSAAFAQERLLWHNVRLDSQKKLLAWPKSDSSYDEIVCKAWDAFKKIPAQPNGYKTYFLYPVFYGPKDTGKNLFEGRDWTHNPCSLFAMLTDSAMLYYAYSGDSEVIPLIRAMLDHYIKSGSTEETDDWSCVPYASSDAGSPQYCGATDTKYTQDTNFLGRGDGVGFLEPDKVGEMGLAYLRFYEFTGEDEYLKAAQHCADALAKHIKTGDQSHSPWPFRVDAKTGKIVKEQYTSNTVGPIRLLDEMIRLGLGNVDSYRKTRQVAWDWLMKYPVKNNIWSQYFEDIYIYPDYRTNINQYCPLETARYLLENPQYDPQWRSHAQNIIDWVQNHFAIDSFTMAGLPEKGVQWGAEAVSEQINDMDKMSSHTARYALVLALWFERTGDENAKERAFRSFNWATYSCRDDGLVKTSLDEGTGYWFSDGYGDYMRHFLRGMASVPQWAAEKQNHLLRSSSIVRYIKYGSDKIVYKTFDATSVELFKLSVRPREILIDSESLPKVDKLKQFKDGYTVESVKGGGFAVRIRHSKPGDITIRLKNN
ncbi:MAG: hypothetical protein ABSE89_00885 [Sedimentisphaerales bacterium]